VLKMLADMGYRVSDASCYQKCRRSQIRGIDQTLRFMGQIRPKRLMQLSDYLWDGKTVRAGKTNDGFKTVVKVDLLGYKQLIDIQTTTKTFIANGLVSHNCDMFDEYAMVTKATSKSSSEDLWQAATPASTSSVSGRLSTRIIPISDDRPVLYRVRRGFGPI